MASGGQRISVVIPLYDGARFVPFVAPALRACLSRGLVDEVLVVDDGSTDGGGDLYASAGFSVLPSGGRLGPAACRNLGARASRGEIILFLDSDVVASPQVPELVLETFAHHPKCVAVFGSYDDRPAAPGVVSQYRNLLHHHVHQHLPRGARAETSALCAPDAVFASTFWAGCGAVRRAPLLDCGGFDAARYPRPSIEDIELGYRLRQRGGLVILRRKMQVKHLKRWTLASVCAGDIRNRALPWGRLLMEPGYTVADLNLRHSERWKALGSFAVWPTALAALLLSLLTPSVGTLDGAAGTSAAVASARLSSETAVAWALAWLAAGLFGVSSASNWRLLRLTWGRGGWRTAAAAVFLHHLYYFNCVVTYGYCLLEARAQRLARIPRLFSTRLARAPDSSRCGRDP